MATLALFWGCAVVFDTRTNTRAHTHTHAQVPVFVENGDRCLSAPHTRRGGRANGGGGRVKTRRTDALVSVSSRVRIFSLS